MSALASAARAGILAGLSTATLTGPVLAADGAQPVYKTVDVAGVQIFYREAGPPDAPVVLLLHGFPTSSHMFRDLIPRLAIRYRVIAPDYPGYGYSDAPSPTAFTYTFDHLAEVMERFTQAVGATRYTLYAQDFGGPVGFRLAARHPERIAGLVVQNAVAHEEGLAPSMDAARPYWRERTPATEAPMRAFLTLETTRFQYLHGARDPNRVSPDSWTHAQSRMDRPGNAEIQLAMLADYGSNLRRYGEWQAYFRARQPPTLVVWGKNDPFFTVEGAQAYARDMPATETHLLDTGHFALEEEAPRIANLMLDFLDRRAFGRAQ
ncbi:alpha/beta fold hydrolase [Salinarimonas soli]|uniref:Alpha/beta hydrolase n=1 Tax=Salinarimonas soli TaxID=1638099 RepID=A0A5B2V8V0_9HYPH|nr:alpha/beta hydrolase [Salinarimonas soli]KAA2235434.1 alpha/beta hydrolase [Salinarimonas soli]